MRSEPGLPTHAPTATEQTAIFLSPLFSSLPCSAFVPQFQPQREKSRGVWAKFTLRSPRAQTAPFSAAGSAKDRDENGDPSASPQLLCGLYPAGAELFLDGLSVGRTQDQPLTHLQAGARGGGDSLIS